MAASIVGSLPAKVQTGEKFRIDLSRTYVHVSEHSLHTMTITVDAVEYEILAEKYFDYDFSSTGTKTLSVAVTTSGQGHPETTKDFTIEVVSASEENLFSDDSQLELHEPDILSYLPHGKSCYKYAHRLSQDKILSELDEKNILDSDGNKLTAADFVDITEVKDWSKFYTLMFIYNSLSNSVEDIFNEKYLRYREYMMQSRNRAVLRFDYDGDGTIEDGEATNVNIMKLVRR